jgi:FkbM family methyltransferase
MNSALKALAARLPHAWQQELKRYYFQRQMSARRFRTDEQEFGLLDQFLRPGDWAIDVGANIGHYTARFSELVGAEGRVVAFEPVPATFELLAANTARLPLSNVTLINAAASDDTRIVTMSVPSFGSGLKNYYMARLDGGSGGLATITLPIDSLQLPCRVGLAKIDAEGHELSVLRGMTALLRRDRPVLIVEDNSPEIASLLEHEGYAAERLAGSSNAIWRSR